MADRVIFHVDANSAFLSWTAAYKINVLGESVDLREIPSVVAGDKASRHSIILAKSTPAKKYGIHTGEPLFQALEKCPNLVVVPPDYELYVEASRHFVQMLRQFSPIVEQYSIDEAWVDMTGTERLWGAPRLAAEQMRKRIWEELGFTVNVGISSNKLLAKMAGDFEKPNKVHTLFPEEVPDKFWPLPVRDLFLVGAATERKLHMMGIRTIGDLAHADGALLRKRLGKHGETMALCQRPQCRRSDARACRKQRLRQFHHHGTGRGYHRAGPSGAAESVRDRRQPHAAGREMRQLYQHPSANQRIPPFFPPVCASRCDQHHQ